MVVHKIGVLVGVQFNIVLGVCNVAVVMAKRASLLCVDDVVQVLVWKRESWSMIHYASTGASFKLAAPSRICLPFGRLLVQTVPFVVTKRSS